MAPKEKLVMNLKLKMPFSSEVIAHVVNDATAPENVEAPSSIAITSRVMENQLIIHIDGQESIKDLISTLDDYLEKIALSIKTIKKVK